MGPTIHTVVMDERTTDLQKFVYRETRTAHDLFVAAQAKVLEEMIRQAYIRGVRDGFQQGALATKEDTP